MAAEAPWLCKLGHHTIRRIRGAGGNNNECGFYCPVSKNDNSVSVEDLMGLLINTDASTRVEEKDDMKCVSAHILRCSREVWLNLATKPHY